MITNHFIKALLLIICITSVLFTTKEDVHSHGFYIVEKPHIHPPRPPHPPFPPHPVPPRPIHRFLPLELKEVKVAAKIRDQVAQTTQSRLFIILQIEELKGLIYFQFLKMRK